MLILQQFLEHFFVGAVGIVGNELRGRHTEILTEYIAEIGMGGEAHAVCDIGDADLIVDQQIGGLLQAVGADEVDGRHTVAFLHFAIELHTTDAYFFGQLIDTERGVVDMCLDGLNDTAEQLVVGRIDGGVVVVETNLGAAQTTHNAFAYADTVCHCPLQHKGVEGLVDEVIDIEVETVDMSTVAALTGEDNDGQVVGIRVTADAPTEFDTVTQRHTDISHHRVGTLGENLLPGTISIVGFHYSVVVFQDVGDIVTE